MDKRLMLPYVGEVIRFRGNYAGHRVFTNYEKTGKARTNKVSTFERIEAMLEGRWRHLGHSHVQVANAIWDLKPKIGDRLEFWAEVYEYEKRNPEGEVYTGIGIANPDGVFIQHAPTTPAPTTPAPATPTVLRRMKEEIGTEPLRRVLQLQAEIGKETLQKALQLQAEIGYETLVELLELLS